MPSIKIVIAEDTTLVRRLLVHQLSREEDIEIIGEAENGREAVEQADKLRPDIVLMDLEMPILNGIEATERIVSQHPYIKVILLTSHEELASIGKLARAAACLKKSVTPSELLTAIRRVYDTRSAAATDQASGGGDHSAVIKRLAVRGALTERETAVLEKMVDTENTGAQIARALSIEWKQEVTDSAIKHTIERVMTKLRVEPRTRAALVKHVLEQDANL